MVWYEWFWPSYEIDRVCTTRPNDVQMLFQIIDLFFVNIIKTLWLLCQQKSVRYYCIIDTHTSYFIKNWLISIIPSIKEHSFFNIHKVNWYYCHNSFNMCRINDVSEVVINLKYYIHMLTTIIYQKLIFNFFGLTIFLCWKKISYSVTLFLVFLFY